MRYRFYREHKYVSFALSDLERLVAKTDFKYNSEVEEVKAQLASLTSMLKGHAEWEDGSIHELLRQKGSSVHKSIEDDHQYHEKLLKQFKNKLEDISNTVDPTEKLKLGYDFYLSYRLFVSENLKHLHQEETIIMPELQRLYSDNELRKLEFNTYSHMATHQMVHMIETLFPHMDVNDYEHFLKDIKDAEPEKFKEVWPKVAGSLKINEREYLIKKLRI